MQTIREHLEGRYVDFERVRPLIDEEDRVACFLLYNFSGQIVGKMQYRPDQGKDRKNDEKYGKYYQYYTEGVMLPVWGLEYWHLSDTLFICEGIFDAIRFINRGYSAIAVFTTNPKPLRRWLQIITQNRKTVAICDAGKGGKLLAKYGKYSMIMEDDDPGSATEEEITDIIERWK